MFRMLTHFKIKSNFKFQTFKLFTKSLQKQSTKLKEQREE